MSDKRSSNLYEQLGKPNPAETVIIGIGNTLKGDDGAGPQLCSILKGNISTEIIDAGSTPENYIAKIVKMSPEKLLIIDAVDFGAPPGTVRIFDIKDLGRFSFSTHCLSPHLFVDMLRSQISVEVFFIGIQPAGLQLGAGLSEQVAKAVVSLAGEIRSVLCQNK